MKRFPILTTTAAVLALMTAGSFAAPKKKTVGDTAKGIIDALLGDDKQPAPAQGKAGAGLAGNVAQFSGKWNIEDGSGAVTVKAAGTAAQVHWDFAKGGGDDGVGIERGGKFYIGYGGVAGPGILVFQIAGGKLTGVGAASKGGVPAAFTETLTGPAGLNGQYMSSRGEKVGIAPAANDSYLVIWTKTKRAGFGKKDRQRTCGRVRRPRCGECESRRVFARREQARRRLLDDARQGRRQRKSPASRGRAICDRGQAAGGSLRERDPRRPAARGLGEAD